MMESKEGKDFADAFDFEALHQIAKYARQFSDNCSSYAKETFREKGLVSETRQLMNDANTFANIAYHINKMIEE